MRRPTAARRGSKQRFVPMLQRNAPGSFTRLLLYVVIFFLHNAFKAVNVNPQSAFERSFCNLFSCAHFSSEIFKLPQNVRNWKIDGRRRIRPAEQAVSHAPSLPPEEIGSRRSAKHEKEDSRKCSLFHASSPSGPGNDLERVRRLKLRCEKISPDRAATDSNVLKAVGSGCSYGKPDMSPSRRNGSDGMRLCSCRAPI